MPNSRTVVYLLEVIPKGQLHIRIEIVQGFKQTLGIENTRTLPAGTDGN